MLIIKWFQEKKVSANDPKNRKNRPKPVGKGKQSGVNGKNHAEVPVGSSAMLMRKQILWMRRPNFFYEMIEYGLYGR